MEVAVLKKLQGKTTIDKQIVSLEITFFVVVSILKQK
jgi:hypothetical protein